MLWAFSHRIILPARKKKKRKIYFKSMLSLLIGMMETILICLLPSTTKSFKMPRPDMLTVLPTTCDKLPHPGCSQHEPQPLLEPTSGVRARFSPANTEFWLDRRSQWQFLNRSVYIDKMHAENVLRRSCQRRKASLTAPVTDQFSTTDTCGKWVLPLMHLSVNKNEAALVTASLGCLPLTKGVKFPFDLYRDPAACK